MYGRSIVDYLGDEITQISKELQQIFGQFDELSREALIHELKMADQNEALRLIASAYREGLLEEDESCCFVIRSPRRDFKVYNASRAIRLRYQYPPNRLIQILFVVNGRETELMGVDGVLTALMPSFEQHQSLPTTGTLTRLLKASHQSVRNEAIALAYKKVWSNEVSSAVVESGGIFSYLCRSDVDSYAFFNQLASFDARRLTPFSKMKLDMSVQDLLTYSPEFSKGVVISLVALSKTKVKISRTSEKCGDSELFFALFPKIHGGWMYSLKSLNRNPDDYFPLPLHPLNRKWVQDNLLEFLSKDDIIFLDDVTIDTTPTLSFRSMLAGQYCLKLPVPIQTTHMIRNIPIPEIEFGPQFSDLFHEVINTEGLQHRLVLERDLLGAHLDFKSTGCSEELSSMLSFVVRQNPSAQISPEEFVVPLAAVLAEPPSDNRPLFLSIMSRNGVNTSEGQYSYFGDYVALVIGTQLELYFRSGLMPEAHQQNLNIVFSHDWKLQRLMYHDLPGGVAAFVPLLQSRYEFPDEMTTRIYYFRETPDRSVLQFVHPTLTAHLMPLAYHLSVHLGLDRGRLHNIVKENIEYQIGLARSISASSTNEMEARTRLIDRFEDIVLRSKTLPTKRMLERFYLQSTIDSWGTKFPNPELLSQRVLVPPYESRNTLIATLLNQGFNEDEPQWYELGAWW